MSAHAPPRTDPDGIIQQHIDAEWDRRFRQATEAMPDGCSIISTAAVEKMESDLSALRAQVAELQSKAEAYDRINTPEMFEFLSAVHNEALHQRVRWGVDQDGGKTDADWFWLVGYLAGKALHDVKGKRLHHIITAAAALLNWHAHAMGAYARMRPGIADPDGAEARV